MLKIDQLKTTSGTTTLKLEGQIIGPWVEELQRSCEPFCSSPRAALTLDVAGVSFVALDGVRLLERLMSCGVAVVNSSPFVAEQLKVMSSC
jgi:STAS domain